MPFRPGERPLHNLAKKLVPLIETCKDSTDLLIKVNKQVKAFQQGDLTLQDIVESALDKFDGSKRLLFVADQFEELFTSCKKPEDRDKFLELLLAAVNTEARFTLILTLRADFYGQALAYPVLAETLQRFKPESLGAMSYVQLQAAIEQPAQLLNVTFEDGLIERILNDLEEKSGNLPLLEFALSQLWNQQKNGRLTHQAYTDIGGVKLALAQRAEQFYRSLSKQEKQQLQKIFVQLVRPGDGTENTRRLATRTEVGEENWGLVNRLSDEKVRLVVTSSRTVLGEQTEETAIEEQTVEIIHEALISGWGRLRKWLEIDRTFRLWQERLRAAIQQWEESNKDKGALLYGISLSEAQDWFQTRQYKLNQSEKKFIEASLFFQKQEQLRQRWITFGLAFCLILTLAFSGIAGLEWHLARVQARLGEVQQIKSLVASSQALLLSDRKFDGLLEGLRAGTSLRSLDWIDDETKDQVTGILRQSIQEVKEYNRLERHSGGAWSVSFSPNGELIATSSRTGTVKLWNKHGQKLKSLKGESDNVSSISFISFSPDSRMIAAASKDGTVKLWDIESEEFKILRGHSDWVYSVSFSPDGETIASGSKDNTVRLWNREGKELKTLRGHKDRVYSVRFSPDGETIASGSKDNTVRLWNRQGQPLQVLKGHSDWVYSIGFSPDGKSIISGCRNGNVKLWNLKGQELQSFKAHSDKVWSVGFSPDGETIASSGDDGTIKLWNKEGEELETLTGHSNRIYDTSFSPDGKTIASASDDGSVKLWRLKSAELKTLKIHNGFVYDVSFSPDGKTIASTGEDGLIKLFDFEGQELRSMQSYSNSDQKTIIYSMDFSPDGKTIAFSTWNETIGLWNLDEQTPKILKGHVGRVYDVSFSPDGKTIASASSDNSVKLWNLDGYEIRTFKGHNDWVYSLSFSPNGRLLASGSDDGTVKLWNLETEEVKTLKGHGYGVYSVSFSPDGETIASASRDGTVKLWNLDGQELKTLRGHSNSVYSVSFSPDGKTIASGSWDRTVKLWNLEGKELKSFKGHSDKVRHVSFSPDGKILASASDDNIIKFWNPKVLNFEELLVRSCNWVSDFLENGLSVSEGDRYLCKLVDSVPTESLIKDKDLSN